MPGKDDSCRFDLRPDGTSAAGVVLWSNENVYLTPAFVGGASDPDHLLVMVNRHGDDVMGYLAADVMAAIRVEVARMPRMVAAGWAGRPNAPYHYYYLGGDPEEDGTPGPSGRTIKFHDHGHVIGTPQGTPTSGMSPATLASAYCELVTMQ